MLRTAIGAAIGTAVCLLIIPGAEAARGGRGALGRSAPMPRSAPSVRPQPRPGGGLARPPRRPQAGGPRLRPDRKGFTPRPRPRPPYSGRPGYWRDPWYRYGSPWGFGWGSPWGLGWSLYSPYYSVLPESAEDGDRDSAGNIEVRVKPDKAEIRVNGLTYGRNGRADFSLPTGPWTLELSAPGYIPQTIQLDVQPGIRYRIERRLEKDATRDNRGRTLPERELAPSRPQQLLGR